MRAFKITLALLLLAVASPASALNVSKKITYEATFHLRQIMKKHVTWIKPGIVRIPMPMDTHYQRLLSVKSTPRYKKLEKKGRFNTAVYDFRRGFPKVLKLKMTVLAADVDANPRILKKYRKKGGEKGYFADLKDSFYDLDNKSLRKAVKKITRGRRSVLDKILAIHRWTARKLTHTNDLRKNRGKRVTPKMQPSYKKASEIYRARTGHCQHISKLFVAMCRVVGVPARTISGLVNDFEGRKKRGLARIHYTAEVYDPELDLWVYVEPQGLGQKLGSSRTWHTAVNVDRRKNPKNFVELVHLYHVERHKLGNKNAITYRLKPSRQRVH